MDEQLSRIPFSRAEEQTINSMARWMRFMAVVGLIGGFLILFLVVLGIGLFAAFRGMGDASPKLGNLNQFFEQAGEWLYFLLGVFLLVAIVTLWQNFALYHAGDYFHQVASTDVADVDNLAHGLDRLRTFFKIQVLVVLITVVAAFVAALAMLAFTRHLWQP
jgi:hypothetical protein